jgi:hypothetical protein
MSGMPEVRALVAAALSFALAACASAPRTDCTGVYVIGDASVAAAVAKGERVMRAGPLPAKHVPQSAPRAALEADGSYGGAHAFCSVPQAKVALADAQALGIAPPGRPLRIYQVGASWANDVYELRPGEYRLKRAVPVLRAAD